MKDSKSKKTKNNEIKITNYMDDFDDEVSVKDDELEEIEEESNEELEEETPTEDKEELEDTEDELDEVEINEVSYDDDKTEDPLFDNVDDEDNDEIDDDEEFNGDIDDIEADERVVKKEIPSIEQPKKKKHYRLKKEGYILIAILAIIIIIIYLVIRGYINHANYLKSDEYALLQKGYSENQVTLILKDEKLTTLCLNHEYDENILSFTTEKYYLEKNLDKYLTYKKSNPNTINSEIVTIINTGIDRDWYDNSKVADTSKDTLILVNKFNYVEETYEIDDLVDMSVKYAFNGRKLRQVAYDAFIEMANAAKGENLKLVANTTYRTYAYQQAQYNNFKNQKGLAYADSKAARPGYSDHQTGLAIDISTLDTTIDFTTTEEFTWLLNNAYRYGFILRYPEGKENITGYSYEPYHYRYVGKEAAAIIKNENITFEEYYAYYVEGNK